ncbi:MAG TPA: FHA domain-containing protein [Longimicrobiaceae bacterium]|nr:FHA domain-containing protein [Longimicrobiaceae bacterium]
MLNLLRKFLRPTLREQLEDGVRETLRRYADRRVAPDLRVYVSTDLVPEGVEAELWARDEAEHLRRFAAQWAQDNGIGRAGLRLEVILLDTKRDFAFVKPVGLEAAPARGEPVVAGGGGASRPLVAEPALRAAAGASGGALFEVVSSPVLQEPLRVRGEVVLGRKAQDGVMGLGDRYMSGRHARVRAEGGRVWVVDLDSKNRTYVNEEPLVAHHERELRAGDAVRLGTTVLRLARADA